MPNSSTVYSSKLKNILLLSLFVLCYLWMIPIQAVSPLNVEKRDQLLKLPLCFEKNEGQLEEQVKYLLRGQQASTYFTQQEIVMDFQRSKKENPESIFLKMQFSGASDSISLEAEQELQTKSRYLIGNDSAKWQTNIPNYAKLAYQNVYPGIDILFSGNQQFLKCSVCVSAYTNPQQIRLKFDQVKNFSINENNHLHLTLNNQKNVEIQNLQIYQTEGEDVSVQGHFVLLDANEVGFAIEEFDETRPLMIDFVLSYTSPLTADSVLGSMDKDGNLYLAGNVAAMNLFTTSQDSLAMGSNGFVTKINSDITAPIYCTYLGSGGQQVHGLAIDKDENVYITGATKINGCFPVTSDAYQTEFKSDIHAFVTKMSVTNSDLIYSTLLGGMNHKTEGNSLTIDSDGNAYVTGLTYSTTFPASAEAFQKELKIDHAYPSNQRNAFVAKLNATGSDLMYASYLGGGTDVGKNIVIDSNKNAYVTGYTFSTHFPTTADAFQESFNKTSKGNKTGFLTKINPEGSKIVYSTYLEKDNALINNIAIDSNGHLSPWFGPTSGGTPVMISGKNFTNATAVEFGNLPAVYFTVDNDQQITAISPPSTGTVNVTVKAESENLMQHSVNLFTYQPMNSSIFLSISPNPPSVGQPVHLVAQISPAIANGTVDFYADDKLLGSTSITNGIGRFVSNALPIGTHHLQAIYRDDAVLSSAISSLVPLKITHLQSPMDVKGRQVKNLVDTRIEYVNILTWKAPNQGHLPVCYRIYKDKNLTQLIGTVNHSNDLKFEERNQKKNKIKTYFIVAIDSFDHVSQPVSVTIAKN